MQRDAATRRQVASARPDLSTWLSANAGSGKTRVLTDRVARLLLEEVDPQHILCLTYTKAAASEMQNRLFDRLGSWAMLEETALRTALQTLGHDGTVDATTLARARRLFARAIETPGGLKIQTIHSFCAGLLRRFPMEAGVSPQFSEMDERSAHQLQAEIIEGIASGPERATLQNLALQFTGETLAEVTAAILRHQAAFAEAPGDTGLAKIFDLPADLTADGIAAQVFLGDEDAVLARLLPVLRASGAQDRRAADTLARISVLDHDALPDLEQVFLTGAGAKQPFSAKAGSFPTRAARARLDDILPRLDAWMHRVEAARAPRLALAALHHSRVLHRFAQVFLPAYTRAKQMRGWLDFDDLILRARALLTRAEVAAWVLYRLDGGIDHILVDEAQDTSPPQWQVIERLAQEFTSGAGARAGVTRTIFVVGDKKQSIYSFQGADPREFDRMQAEFAERLESAGAPLQALTLAHSFRSSPAILSAVDHAFAGAADSGFDLTTPHVAFHGDLPGRVDLWPVVDPPGAEDPPPWHSPVDHRSEADPAIVLARRIAAAIRAMIDRGQAIPDRQVQSGFRALRPGDVLILVQRRSILFHEVIRACKAEGLEVAGADRLKIGGELAVRDLTALLSFLVTPDDNLSLATALRAPLFGWSEADLFRLASGRQQPQLWQALRHHAEDHPETLDMLTDLRDAADFLRPYDLLERILTRHDGRRRLLARLGAEAEDGIDALLAQAMVFEEKTVDSLTGFLVWLETDEVEIKRQMDSAGDRIRVMTVHGAKGLESPVVILPDTARRRIDIRDHVISAQGVPVWRGTADAAPTVIATATEARKTAERAERDRLLYVAMTRAETWLIVAAHGDPGQKDESWYAKIRHGLQRAGATPLHTDDGPGLRLQHHVWAETGPATPFGATSPLPDLPAHLRKKAPQPGSGPETRAPSDLGGDKALPGEAGQDDEPAKRRGRQVHRLLEVLPTLPRDSWAAAAARLLAHGPDAAIGPELAQLLAEAQGVLTSPGLAPLFARDALAEVPVSAPVAALGGQRIHGTIDRLLVDRERVLAVDFKTNAAAPDSPATCPDGLLRQMGAYAHALQTIYPDRRVETALLWTRSITLMPLPHDLVTAALRATRVA